MEAELLVGIVGSSTGRCLGASLLLTSELCVVFELGEDREFEFQLYAVDQALHHDLDVVEAGVFNAK